MYDAVLNLTQYENKHIKKVLQTMKLHRPQRLPDLLFKFNVLDADQYVLEFCIDENNVSTR